MTNEVGARPLVVGVGNDDRADDGAGLDVARELASRPAVPADVRLWTGELTGLLDLWRRRSVVIVVDAVRSGAAPGTVRRWTAEELSRSDPARTFSTHGVGLPAVFDLARTLGELPDHLVVYGIEAAETGAGAPRSEPVRRGVALAAVRIAKELERFAAPPEAGRGGA